MQWTRVLTSGACVGVVMFCTVTVARSNTDAGRVSGRVAAFDLATGALRFDVPMPTASAHVHAIGSGVVIVSGADSCRNASKGSLAAFALTSGARRWTIPYGYACEDYSDGEPIAGGIVALQMGRGIAGIDARTGKTRWEAPTLNNPGETASLVVTTADKPRGVTFLDPRTGRVRASTTARRNPFAWLLTRSVAVFVTQGHGEVGGVETRLTAIDPRSGRRLWQRSVGLTSGASGPTGADGVVLFTRPIDPTTSEIDAFDTATGAPLWQRRSVAPFSDVVAAAGSGVAVLNSDSDLVALDVRTGAERWRAAGAAGVLNVGQGTVISVRGSVLEAFDAATGTPRWHAPLPPTNATWFANTTIGSGVVAITATSASFQNSIG